MKIFHVFNRLTLIALSVTVISILAGAGAMAAIAHATPETIIETEKKVAGNSLYDAQKKLAKKQKEIQKKQKEISRRQKEIIKRQKEIARSQKKIAAEQKQKLNQKKAQKKTLYARHDKKNTKKKKNKNVVVNGSSASSLGISRLPIGNFKKICATGAINVVFTQGESDGYAEVHGDTKALECIRFTYDGDLLTIGYKKSPGTISTRTIVYVTAPRLEGINFSGATSITVQGILKCDILNVEASGASDINIPHVIGKTLNIGASGASNVQVLSAEMQTINANASGASDIKLKGVCATTVNSCAVAASEVSAIGRCNYKNSESSSAGTVKDQGLIIENSPLDCTGKSYKKKTMPRKP